MVLKDDGMTTVGVVTVGVVTVVVVGVVLVVVSGGVLVTTAVLVSLEVGVAIRSVAVAATLSLPQPASNVMEHISNTLPILFSVFIGLTPYQLFVKEHVKGAI